MTMIYSNPSRENENDGTLPDVDVFYNYGPDSHLWNRNPDMGKGWYWQRGTTGKTPDFGYSTWTPDPDDEPNGPFATEAEAITDAQYDDASEQDYERMTAGDAIETDDEPADDEPGDEDYYLSDDERSIYYLGKRIVGPVHDENLCPVCGESITITGKTTDGRIIGVCGDAFQASKWDNCPQDAVMRELAKYVERSGYFPNVWKISDHGNPSLISVQGCGCYFTEHIGEKCSRQAEVQS